MLSNQILTSCKLIVQTKFLSKVPKQKQRQFLFGFKALSLKPIVSLNTNARSVKENRNTAESSMTRTLHNEGLPHVIAEAVAKTGLLTPGSLVNCDHSDFDGLTAFVLALQTGKGRAVPVYVNTAYSGKLPASGESGPRKEAMRKAYQKQEKSLYEQTEIDLEDFTACLGFWPRLVLDRGFGGLKFIRFLARHNATFYIRLKKGRLVELGGKRITVKKLSSPDSVINLGNMRLRVVRSDTPQGGEPWYILTSDLKATRKRIIKIYYYRFEIEESFKDIKHLRDLERLQVNLALSLKVVLWFVILGIILLYLCGIKAMGKRKFGQITNHPKKKLSWYRWLWELLEWLLWKPLYDTICGP